MSDIFFMRRALALAEEPARTTSPNPRVGAVLVRDGSVVARGYHVGPGSEHAEEMAIREAGSATQGATLYCTLEPCSHTGEGKRRPPCAPLIVRSGVRRVVIAQLDPNPRVRGNGVALLRAAGIEVAVGTNADDAVLLNRGFNTFMSLGRPFVHLKCAQSLDGRCAASDGSSRWITDAMAREHAHRERGRHDAILVGIGTALADDPLLTVRHGPSRQPLAVVLDTNARLPIESRLVRERPRETLILAGPSAPASRLAALRAAGLSVLQTGRLAASRVDLREALDLLAAAGIRSIYVEGGTRTSAAFLRSDLYDQVTSYIAPILIGGPNLALEPQSAETMDAAVRLDRATSETVGDQAVITGFRPGWWQSIRLAMGADTRARETEERRVHRAR